MVSAETALFSTRSEYYIENSIITRSNFEESYFAITLLTAHYKLCGCPVHFNSCSLSNYVHFRVR